jgi:hypothetical protein
VVSYCQFVGRNYEEAVRFARQSVRLRADFVGGHRVLTAAAACGGFEEIAAEALKELKRVQPEVSLEWIAKEMPFRHEAEREAYVEGFRLAGLE